MVKRKLVRRVVWWGSAVVALGCCGVVVLGMLGGWSWALDLFAHFRWHAWVGLVVALVGAVVARGWWLAGGIAVAVGVVGVSVAPGYFGDGRAVDGERVRIVHVNALASNDDFEAVIGEILAHGADLVSVQEVSPALLARIRGEAGLEVVAHETRGDNFGIALLRRVGSGVVVEGARVFRLVEGGPPVIEAEVGFGGGVVRVLAMHPLPPVSGRAAGERNAMLAAAGEWCAAGGEVVVVGDLNATVWSAPMRGLVGERGLRVAGGGLAGTWPSRLPGVVRIGIDHCLYSDGLVCTGFAIGGDVGSDHLPIVVELGWAAPPGPPRAPRAPRAPPWGD